MARLANLRIGVRLAAMAGTSLVVLMVVLGIGLNGIHGQQRAARELQANQVVTRAAMQVKFRSADFNGWQTAYAFDVVRGVHGAAADNAESRAAFLASAGSFRAELAAVAAMPAGTEAQDAVAAVQQQFAKFMDLDTRIVAAYRTGRPDQIRYANGLVLVQEIQIFTAITAGVDKLVAALDSAATVAGNDAQAAAAGAQRLMIVGTLLALLVGIGIAWLVSRSITGPLGGLRRRLAEIADGDGDVTQRLPATSRDELGQVAAAFNRFVVRVQDLLVRVSATGERVHGAAAELLQVSGDLQANATSTDARAAAAAHGADQISRSVEVVSAGAEEMGASITEIAQNASQAAQVATSAVAVAEGAGRTVARLDKSSTEIGTVLRLISAVAGQTNLLALNATIEAARAGDAGLGFAVVAAEVKQLAQETARATDDISARVTAIQADTAAAVTAIEEITNVVEQISNYSTSIAAATEEQTATTAEMARSITDAATGTGEVATNVTGVAGAARDASAGAATAQRTATELGTAAEDLRELLGTFRY
jgi:methyl-accepting chemotaxis protein